MVGIGKFKALDESTFESFEGPKTDLLMILEAEPGSDYEEKIYVSYKIRDKAKALKPGQVVKFPCYLEALPRKKGGFWVKKIALDVEPVNAA